MNVKLPILLLSTVIACTGCQTAKNLLSMNMKVEDISKATGLSVEEINKLKNEK